ncbi:prolyl oligopeptidase family serine peptidase [Paenarthrobacter sp. DKR-5]|uniref:prolyl oligopeptidase family serine peptidase n=1 Tax=Paenarthrobacter sp. DKR-5 TaxID=2835535 RepID=UPI001BDDC7F9|nr:prolyl oligopeptidase family serine peptidase [Paenarthrobacter sp. DKR-5]MBT1003586.1 prolyl oligopeptidase family serine peptidase [Paenarthrobacter sp. DKR-5]
MTLPEPNASVPQDGLTPQASPTPQAGEEDEFLWLEDIHGAEQLAWVREQNSRTEALLVSAKYRRMEASVLEVLDSSDRIPMATKRGDWYYNFWRDEANPRGLWRRTGWDSYRQETPEWDVLLDLDELGRSEGRDWVFAGAQLLRPADGGREYRRALLSLSPDGGDAKEVREFDLDTRSFVDGGFRLPAAKTNVSWLDEDTLLVATDFGPGSMTASSYPRTVRVLRRGGTTADAEPFFEVPAEHVMAFAVHDSTPGFERTVAVDMIDFYNRRVHLRRDGGWDLIEVPTDVNVDLHRQWLVLRPRQDWECGGTLHPAGSLLVVELERFLAGERALTTLFTPDEHTALEAWSWTKDHLLLNLLQDVSSRIEVLTPREGSWARSVVTGMPALESVSVSAVDDEDESCGNDYWLVATGFTTPTSLLRGTAAAAGGAAAEPVKRSPSYFNDGGYRVEQHFAVSRDGTRVPYFQVASADLVLDGGNPTLLSGYGGFEISRTPAYSGAVGRSWLERRTPDGRGGVYVVANIRGGGEYGPSWHRAALRENRHRAYEDFAAVAQDLTRRGVTSRGHLGCEGRSNGGLLVGNMLTLYPELFGAVSCGVPLLDMRRYTRLSAGHSWIAEYGDPDDPAQWEFIRTFSPYHNVRAGAEYPPSFIWTATSDDRVGPVQARKMAARLQRLGHANAWFYESLEGGHTGAADNKQAARLHCYSHEFLWQQLA